MMCVCKQKNKCSNFTSICIVRSRFPPILFLVCTCGNCAGISAHLWLKTDLSISDLPKSSSPPRASIARHCHGMIITGVIATLGGKPRKPQKHRDFLLTITKTGWKGSVYLAVRALRAMAQALSKEPGLTRSTYAPRRPTVFDSWDAMEDLTFFGSNLL